MSDIFISYSRKDSAHALGLAERLRAAGLEVWIDQHGIEAAAGWRTEIEQAIKECRAFCLLLSNASLESNNVVKETSLASEFKRSIVLIELYAVKLTNDFYSQLAGFPRMAFTDFDAILLALNKLGIGLEPSASSPISQAEQTGTGGTPELQDLSPNSAGSKNVVRELAPASEKGKPILPIRLDHVAIPEAMEHQLAGIQRPPVGEDEALLHAIKRLELVAGAADVPRTELQNGTRAHEENSSRWRWVSAVVVLLIASATAYFMMHAPSPQTADQPTNTPHAATLMIIPLDDQSQSQDLGRFANALLSDLWQSLSSIQGIRMIDQTTSISYRGASTKRENIAKENKARYLLEGSVFSSGRKLRILLHLFDEEKGTSLYTGEFEGTVDQVFEMQDSIARVVLKGMQIKLSADEEVRLANQGLPRYGPHMAQ